MVFFKKGLINKFSVPQQQRNFEKVEESLCVMDKKVIPALEKPTDPSNPNHDPVYYRCMVIYYSCFLRAQEIANSFVLSFNDRLFLSCILLARSAQELTAWIYVVHNRLKNALEYSDWQTINSLFDKFLVSSKIFEIIYPNGTKQKVKPFGSGEVVKEMKKIMREWGKDYDFFNEIIHFNHGGQAYYQRIMPDNIIGFYIPEEFTPDIVDHLVPSILLMLEVIFRFEGFFVLLQISRKTQRLNSYQNSLN